MSKLPSLFLLLQTHVFSTVFLTQKTGAANGSEICHIPDGKVNFGEGAAKSSPLWDRMRLKGLGPGPHRTLLPWNTGKSKPQTRSSRLSKPALEPQKRSNVRLETLKGTNQKNDTSGMDMGVSFLRPDNHTNQQRQLSGSYALRVEA